MGETHLVESFVAIDGYSVVRGDVRGLIRKLGVCLYVSNNLQFEEVEIGCPNLAAVQLVHYDLLICGCCHCNVFFPTGMTKMLF